MNFNFLAGSWNQFLNGTLITLVISIISVSLGLGWGFLLALAKMSNNKILKGLGWFYTWIIRGTPLFLQLLFWYVVLPKFGENYREVIIAIIALIINEGAYGSEIIRSGIKSVNVGQSEAASVLGLSKAQFYKYILIPQMFKNILPNIGNELVTIIKDTSLASSIAVFEVMNVAKQVGSSTFNMVEGLIVAAAIYLFITTITTLLIGKFEKKLEKY